MSKDSALGRFATRHSLPIVFISLALCLAGIYAALTIPSSVFPQTNFPRVVILIDNGVMPADEMMATITRPIEEGMKDIPGVQTIRSATGRGSAEVNVFFNWKVDMIQSELYVLGRLSQIRASLPATAEAEVYRVTFSNFPIIGVSLTSPKRSLTDLWETARYTLKPRFLQIPGVARVDLTGGRTPEFHIVVDPVRLQAAGLTLAEVTEALNRNNLVMSTGLHEENRLLYLAVVDGRVRSIADIESFPVAVAGRHPVLVRDFARVVRGPEPVFNYVTAEGQEAVLLNIYSQPEGSTLDIAKALTADLAALKRELSPDLKLAFFYDQSLLVRASVRSVWEAILFGLALSVLILFFFLKSWRTTFVAILVIPVTVLVTLLSIKAAGMSFNLMTLGGIAAAIGLVIDDAIVVVEAIHTKRRSGRDRVAAIREAIDEIVRPLIGSTLTPVVVFIPLAFLSGITGVFFRALALTMVVALLTSLVLAVTLTPSLAAWLLRAPKEDAEAPGEDRGGRLLRKVIAVYETGVRAALKRRGLTIAACGLILVLAVVLVGKLESEFLPPMDEGGFVIDYLTPPGTSLAETHRQLRYAENIIRSVPELESYSRRTGAQLGLFITEPNNGDFLLKLKPDRERSTEEVLSELRRRLNSALPDIIWEFPGILGDLIGDLMYAPEPIEVRLYSTDTEFLKAKAPEVGATLEKVPGVVDVFNGLVYTGPTISFRIRPVDAQRFGLSAEAVGAAVNAAMLGETASTVLEGDRVVEIRVKAEPEAVDKLDKLRVLPLRTPDGALVQLGQVADVVEEPGQLELRRDDFRQDVAVTARLEGRDMGSAMREIRRTLARDPALRPGAVEYGGLYEQQQESFRNLVVVLLMAIFLVFTVLILEFGSFAEPLAIVGGAVLAMFGTILALALTGTSLNVVSLLGAIIGVGIVAKNGILMLDFVKDLRAQGCDLAEALVRSGRRRLRPVLMTSLAAGLGMLPLAYGIGSGADMLRPLAIAVIGALCVSVLLSLVATPTLYYLLVGWRRTG
ncbi:MAG: efflux RND transporter permease subunit [Candidatus Aminicenantes bacterium]|nr:efflux RND transporter permease subunit [Candidatus Aminicenantes bacterium]NLH75705.1 efflux RND transporter permease subunit [Acidobacteriota bacterium]